MRRATAGIGTACVEQQLVLALHALSNSWYWALHALSNSWYWALQALSNS